MNRNELINKLIDEVGSGKANIIQCNRNYRSGDFLTNGLKLELQNKFPEHNVVVFTPITKFKRDMVQLLSALKQWSSEKPVIVLIHDLFYYHNPDAIINILYGSDQISGFITTDVNVSYELGKRDTLVRGRYNTFYLVPSLLNDTDKDQDDLFGHLDSLNLYDHKEYAAKIYRYIVTHSGELLSYRDIYKETGKDMTLGVLIKAIDFMVNHNMLYRLSRVDISNMKELTRGFIYYPAYAEELDGTNLSSERKYILKSETYLISRMIYDGLSVKKAISYIYKEDGNKRIRVEFNRGFLVGSYDKNVVIKPYFDNNEEELQRLVKSKMNIPHIVALLGNSEYRMDKNGLTYVGLDKLLTKGLDGYGRI